MRVNKFNSEGYADPTAHAALVSASRKIKHWRPLVYICSPYSGDVETNTEKARNYCRFAVDHGVIPIAPHLLYPQFMSEESERQLATFFGIVLLGRCEEMWVFGNDISEGMDTEIRKARKKQIKIRYFTEDLKEIN